jgi:transposase InsO family protein
MSNPRYPEEFKIEAVKQVTKRGLPVAEVAARLGMSTHSLYACWRLKPKQEVMIHSDQGSQFISGDWQSFLKANNLLGSMSRRGRLP